MTPPPTPPVTVVGRGVVALTAALLAKSCGFAPKVLSGEISTETANAGASLDPRVVALNGESRALLSALGVWASISASRITPIKEMHVSSAQSRVPMAFSALEAQTEALAWVVEHRDLMRVLEEAVRHAGIARVLPEALAADFSAQRTFGATLVADAGQTAWLERIGLSVQTVPYHHTALVFNVKRTSAHRNAALQVFAPDCAPQSVVALLPRPDRHATVVWSLSDESFAGFQSQDDVALCAALNNAFVAFPKFDSVLDVTSERQSVPLKLVTAPRVAADRCALVGDAAHGIHPLAGQGLNLGFGDLVALQTLWRAHRADPGHPLVLAAYARARAAPVTHMQALTDGLWRSISGAWPGAAALRHVAFDVVRNVAPLRKVLGRQAFGALHN